MENSINRRIRYFSSLFFVLFIVIPGCQNNGNEQLVSLRLVTPVVIKINGVEIFQYWEFKNNSILWDTNYVSMQSLQSYRDSLEGILGKNTFNLTLNNIAFQNKSYHSVNSKNGDSINAQLVHSKSLGRIRAINILEAQLLDYQLNRYPLLSHPTEFHGFILLQDSLNLVKVYFAASDQPWPPKPQIILEAIKKDLRQGWTFKYHLHNHYEPKSNHYFGILAPSITDAQYYMFLSKEFNLEQALITNGFHTVEINRTEFQKFKSPDNI
jgi:hypothetical protein